MTKTKKKGEAEITVEANVDGEKVIEKTYGPMIEAVDFLGKEELRKLSTRDLRRIYESDDMVGPIIDAIACSCTTAGYHFEAYPGEKINQRHLEIVTRFFDEPNEDDTMGDLFYDCFLDMLTYGTEYWEETVSNTKMVDYKENLMNEKVKPDDIEIPYELYRLNPEYIKVRANKYGKITSFAQIIKGQVKASFKANKVIYFKMPRPGSSLYGLAPAAKRGTNSAIAANIYCSAYNGKFFKNNATPRLHIDLGNVSEPEHKKFMEYLDTHIKGQPHKNIVTVSKNPNNKVTIEPISLNNSDMEFSTFARSLRQKIFGAYKMQPIIMGITEDESKTTVPAQISIYKAQAVKPLQRIVAGRINRKVMKKMFPGVRLKFKFNPVDVLDEMEQMKITQIELETFVKTVNDVLRERGLPLKPYGDEPIIPFSNAALAQLPAKPKKKEDAKEEEEKPEDEKEE